MIRAQGGVKAAEAQTSAQIAQQYNEHESGEAKGIRRLGRGEGEQYGGS